MFEAVKNRGPGAWYQYLTISLQAAASRGRASVGKPEGQHIQSRQDLSLQVAMYKLVFQAYTDRVSRHSDTMYIHTSAASHAL